MKNKMLEKKRVFNDIQGLESNLMERYAWSCRLVPYFPWNKDMAANPFVKGIVAVLELIYNSDEQYRVVENNIHAY